MELRVLRYFLAIAKESSFTGAANFLNITQPTLSRQIKELEEELGQQLFIRGNHNISLTAEGMIFRKRAEEIMEMVSKTKAELSDMQKNISGEIYIGSGETNAMRLVAEVIKDLRHDYPQIHYNVYSGNAEDVMERLDKGLLDFGVLIQPTDISKYEYLSMPAQDLWGIIMRNDSPLAEKVAITRKDLLNIPLICSRQILRPTTSGNEVKDWFGDDFNKLNIITTYNLLFNAALLVEQGIGYATALDKLVNTMDNNNLCFRPFSPRLESALNIVWKKYQVFSPATEVFLQAIRKKFGE